MIYLLVVVHFSHNRNNNNNNNTINIYKSIRIASICEIQCKQKQKPLGRTP